jgi:hypothetical protein
MLDGGLGKNWNLMKEQLELVLFIPEIHPPLTLASGHHQVDMGHPVTKDMYNEICTMFRRKKKMDMN